QWDLVYIAYSSGGRVYKSLDGGGHWAKASGSGGGALPNIPISALGIDRDPAGTLYRGAHIGGFRGRGGGAQWGGLSGGRPRDGGANWEAFSGGLPRVVVSGLVLRRANNTLYVSTMGRGAYQRAL